MKTNKITKTKTKTLKPSGALAAKSRVAAPKKAASRKAKVAKSRAPVAQAIAAPALMPAPVKKAVSTDEIARRAYSIWEQQGRPSGKEREHWLLAEQQLQAA